MKINCLTVMNREKSSMRQIQCDSLLVHISYPKYLDKRLSLLLFADVVKLGKIRVLEFSF